MKKLDWDSDFFNIRVGEILYEEEIDTNEVKNFDLLYIKSGNDFDLEVVGFENSFSEQKIIFSKDVLDIENVLISQISTYDESKHSLHDIYQLAYESGTYSRFNLDEKIGEHNFRKMYDRWVDNSINKRFAEELLVFEENSQVIGFITYKIILDRAYIGLIAVNSTFQRKGIGQKLLLFVESKLYKQGIKKLLIPTQERNSLACSFYAKQGYSIEEITYIKHYWRK